MASLSPTDNNGFRWNRKKLRDYAQVMGRLPVQGEFVTPTKPCSFSVDATVVSTSDACILDLHVPFLSVGLSVLEPDYTAFLLPVSWDGELRINGQEANTSTMYLPSDQEGFFIKGGNRNIFAYCLKLERLAASISALQGIGQEDVSPLSQFYEIPKAVRAHLISELTRLTAQQLAIGSQSMVPADLDELSTELYGLIANAYLLLRPETSCRQGLVRSPERLVRKAEEYFSSNQERRISLVDLCQFCGVSKRTLFYAFDSVYGESPIDYFRKRRLMMVRSSLYNTPCFPGAVKFVALSHGFRSLGRFANDYFSLFGEYPSATLGASPG